MSATVHALGEDLGWVVDYEDPPHDAQSPDVFEIASPDKPIARPDESRFIGLKGGTFVTGLTSEEAASTLSPLATIERIVGEYNRTTLPGRFSVRSAEGRIAVVGVATRAHSGEYAPTPVLLDTPIELTSSTETIYEALSSIAVALTKSSGHQVEVGTAPSNLLLGTQCTTPSGKLPSRVAVGRILDTAPVKLAYYLLHDLNQDLYVLNVGVVTLYSKTAKGEEQRAVVRPQK